MRTDNARRRIHQALQSISRERLAACVANLWLRCYSEDDVIVPDKDWDSSTLEAVGTELFEPLGLMPEQVGKPQRPAILGYYDGTGYTIETATGVSLYSAGANAVDSQAGGRGVPMRTIRSWCIRTGREIARERNQAWAGAQRRIAA